VRVDTIIADSVTTILPKAIINVGVARCARPSRVARADVFVQKIFLSTRAVTVARVRIAVGNSVQLAGSFWSISEPCTAVASVAFGLTTIIDAIASHAACGRTISCNISSGKLFASGCAAHVSGATPVVGIARTSA
jgi:hypothetical protein